MISLCISMFNNIGGIEDDLHRTHFIVQTSQKLYILKTHLLGVTGCSGGPAILMNASPFHSNAFDMDYNEPDQHIIVGITSFADYSSLKSSGIGNVIVSNVLPWIREIVSEEVCWNNLNDSATKKWMVLGVSWRNL